MHLVLKDAHVEINGVDLSQHVRQVTITYEAEVVEDNSMGVSAQQKRAGLLNWNASIEFAQDYDAAQVDATLFPLVGQDDVPFLVRPTSDPVGPTNPQYSGVGMIASYQPLNGTVGALATAPITFEGSGLLTRSTT